jgi:hypothetical protein
MSPEGHQAKQQLLEGSTELNLANQESYRPQQQERTTGKSNGHIDPPGLRNKKPAIRTLRGPRVTQHILYFNSYTSSLTSLYHGLGNYLAVSPVQARAGCSRTPIGRITNGYSPRHYIVPPKMAII